MTAKAAAKFTTTSHMLEQRFIDRLEGRKERGASALEYVGMILVAAIVVGAVFAAIRGVDVAGKLKTALGKIMGGK